MAKKKSFEEAYSDYSKNKTPDSTEPIVVDNVEKDDFATAYESYLKKKEEPEVSQTSSEDFSQEGQLGSLSSGSQIRLPEVVSPEQKMRGFLVEKPSNIFMPDKYSGLEQRLLEESDKRLKFKQTIAGDFDVDRNMLTRAAGGFANGMAALPSGILNGIDFLNDLINPAERNYEEYIKSIGGTPPPSLIDVVKDADWYKEYIDNLKTQSDIIRGDKTIVDYVKSGNYKEAAGQAITETSMSLPLTFAALFGGWGGLAAIGTVSAGEKYDQLKDSDLSQSKRLLNSTINGSLEVLTETITAGYGKMLGGIYLREGAEEGTKIVSTGLKKWLKEPLKKMGVYTAPVGEGLSEGLNGMAQYLSDVSFGLEEYDSDKMKNIFLNDFAVGATMGTGFSLLGTPGKLMKPRSEIAKENADIKKSVDVNLPNVNKEEYLNNKIKDIPVEYSKESKQAIVELMVKKDEIIDKSKNVSEDIKPVFDKQIKTIDNSISDIVENEESLSKEKIAKNKPLEKAEIKTKQTISQEKKVAAEAPKQQIKATTASELSEKYIKDTSFRQKVNERAKEEGRDYATLDDKKYVYYQLSEPAKTVVNGYELNDLEQKQYNEMVSTKGKEYTDNFFKTALELHPPEIYNVDPSGEAKKNVKLKTEINEEKGMQGETPEEVISVQQVETPAELPTNSESTTQEDTFESVVTKGLDKGIDWLDGIDKELSKFSNESLGMNLPVAVAQMGIKTAKLTLQAGKTVSEAVDSAITAIKNSDWYKGLDNDQKVQAENDAANLFKSKPSDIIKTLPTEQEFETIPKGEKQRRTAKKALASKELSDELKEAVKKNDKYTVSNHKAMKEKFSKVVNKYVESDNVEELKSIILNPESKLEPEVKVILASVFVENMEQKASVTVDKVTSDYYKEQAQTVFSDFLLPLTTQLGKGFKAIDVLSDIIGANPDLFVNSVREKINIKNEETLKAYENDVSESKKIIDDFLASEEFNDLLNKKIKEASIDKTKSADRIERGRAKMASGANKIMAALGGLKNAISEHDVSGDNFKQVVDGLIEFADGLLDIGMVSADSLFREIKTKFREYLTPSEIDKYRDTILKETDAKNRFRDNKKYSSRDILSESELNSLINKVYGKMTVANKDQLKRLAVDYIDRILQTKINGGSELDSRAFKELFAKAIGLDTLTEKHENTLREIAKDLNDARNITDNLNWLYTEAEKVSKSTDKASVLLFNKLNSIIDEQLKEFGSSMKKAREANKKAGDFFAEDLSFGDLGATLIQGNLITPASQLTNVAGNTMVMIPRSAAYFLGNATDLMWYGIDKWFVSLREKFNNVDFIRRKLAKIEPKRHFAPKAAAKGFVIGFGEGLVEGAQQLLNGQLPEDIYTRELKRGLAPIKAAIDDFKMLSGKEQLKITKFIKNAFESTLGLSPELTFRLLNLGDKPFRRAAEKSRLYELASTEGLTGIEAEHFINLPPDWAFEEARQAGLKATYQNDNVVSNAILKAGKGARAKLDSMDKTIQGMGRFFVKSQLPFVKTPTNVMIETFEYGIPPYSLALSLKYSRQGDSRNASLYFGKAIVGTIMDAAITALLYSGVISLGQAAGEDDEEAKKRVRESESRNLNAYSINVDALRRWLKTGDSTWREGDTYRSYKRFGLFSSLMMGRAEALRGKDLGSKENIFHFLPTLHRQLFSIFPMVRASLQQSYLSGVNTLLSSVFGGDEDIDKWIVSTSRAFSATVIPQTYAKYNDYRQVFMKERRDEAVAAINKKDKSQDWEAVKKQWEDLYGSGDNLTNKLTVWGEDIRYIPDGKGLAWYLFDITQSKTYNNDFGVKLHELYQRTNEENVLPAPVPVEVKFNDQIIKLTDDLRYELEKSFRTFKRTETELFVNSSEFDEMSDEQKIEELDYLYKDINSYKSDFVDEFVNKNYAEIENLWETQKK